MQQRGLIVFLFFRSRTINRSRSLRSGFFLTGGIQITPACTVSESTETPSFSELTADIEPHRILSVHSCHQPRPDADWKAQKVCGCFLMKDMKESEARLLRNVLGVKTGTSARARWVCRPMRGMGLLTMLHPRLHL